MAFANLVVRIAGDITSLDRATKSAVNKIKAFGSDLQSVGSTLALGVSAPLTAFGAIAIKSAADLEALKKGLEVVTGSAGAAAKQFEQLKEVAKLPGLGLREAVQGAVNLQAVGFSADKTRKILLEFGNALASVGRGREDLNEVIRQLGQLANRGKVTADNLKPIIERVPQVASIINREFGTIDTEALQKLGISSEQFIDVLIGGLGKLQRVNGGLKNDIENLRDSLDIAFAEAGTALAPFAKQFIDEFAVPAIEKLKELAIGFRNLPKPVQDLTIQVGALAAAAPLLILATGNLITNITAISAAMKVAAASTGVLGSAMTALPFVAIVAGTALATKAILDYTQTTERAADAQRRLQAAQDTANEKSTAANTHFAQYDAAGRKIIKTHGDLRDSLLAHVGAMSNAATATANAATQAPKYEQAIAAAATVTKDFTNAVRGQTLEAEILRETLSQLEAKHRQHIQSLVELRMGATSSTDAFAELPPVLDQVGRSTRDVLVPYNHLQATLDEMNGSIRRHLDVLGEQREALEKLQKEGRNMDPMYDRAAKSANRATTAIGKSAAVMQRQVSTITTDLSRALADLALEGGKLKDRLSDAFESIGKALLRSAIEAQLQRISKLVIDLLSKLPGLGGALDAVFGGGASAAGGAASAAGGAASAAGSVAGSVGGGASQAVGSSLSGWIGAISGAVTAVSSVVSNFQFAGMNKSLDIIVKHTLQTANQLIYGLQPQVNQYLPYLEQIHQRLIENASQGNNNIHITVNGAGDPEQTGREIMRQLKLQGALR